MAITIDSMKLDGYDLWSELTDSLGSVDMLRAELARRADEGDEIASLHRQMFGPWENDMPENRCGNCIYWSQGGICLAHYCNLVENTGESLHAGKETQESDTCDAWYEGEIGLDAMDCTPDPWWPMEVR